LHDLLPENAGQRNTVHEIRSHDEDGSVAHVEAAARNHSSDSQILLELKDQAFRKELASVRRNREWHHSRYVSRGNTVHVFVAAVPPGNRSDGAELARQSFILYETVP
tara:strand:+ start:465 stop:788 length:324 start_codon:yes stop_codon:yes gene_type:complete